jgi:hypothetical protein
MGQVNESPAVCNSCGETWDINHVGLCPKCGKGTKLIKINLQGSISFKGSLDRMWRQEYYKANKCVRNINIGITILAPFLGLALSGIIGVIAGLAFGVLSYILSPYAITKTFKTKEWDAK